MQAQLKGTKRQNIALYDGFDELVKRGEVMMQQLREKKQPPTTREEFGQWDNDLTTLAESCATINERNRLRDSNVLEIGDSKIMEIYLHVAKECWPIAENVFVKLKVAREIMDRLRQG